MCVVLLKTFFVRKHYSTAEGLVSPFVSGKKIFKIITMMRRVLMKYNYALSENEDY